MLYFEKTKLSFATFDKKVPQLSCGSINFYYFFVIYFYSKEFVSLSQKLDKHTTNSSKVRRVTLMVESSLGIPNVPKVKRRKNRERKNTQNKSKTHGDFGERHCRICLLSLSAADVFQQDLVQFNLSKPFIPTLAP